MAYAPSSQSLAKLSTPISKALCVNDCMRKNLKISLIIGTCLGSIIAVSSNFSPIYEIGVSIVSCVIAGFLTVLLIDNKPNLYAMPASIVSLPVMVFTYGIEIGLFYTLAIIWGYGICSVQLFQIIGYPYDNFKSLRERIQNKC